MKILSKMAGSGKVLLFLLAAASCAFGVWRGEMALVLQKAAAICLECCGIG